jgi:hypothetical protein
MHLEQYDRIRDRIAAGGLTPEIQTRIALFLCASKAINLPVLPLAAAVPAHALVWQAMNTQLFRESEAVTLLLRVTSWSPDPRVYLQNAQLVAPLCAESARLGFRGWPLDGNRVGLDTLALGHALLATVRLAPILPEGEMQAPFAVALMTIEQENGRLLQTQIRLLKDGFAGVSVEARETVIAEKAALVEAAFTRLLDALSG